MICNGLFSKHLLTVIDTNDFETSISRILKTIEYSKTHKTTYYTHEDSVYAGNVEGKDFAAWVYDFSDPCLSDIKQELLLCELHTKFSTYNRDATKQDRIYFHKGKKGILEDKLIVIHIGDHA